jgi:hypothetical protein
MAKRMKAILPLAFLAVFGACNKATDTGPVGQGPQGGRPGMGPGGPMGAPGGRSPISDIMVKLTKGPQSLTPRLGQELQEDPPAWETIQPQAKEFAELASSMSKYDPPKGSKESWAEHTGSYAKSAEALNKAAQSKDKEGALAAHSELASACKACHQEHRMGPGGPGGFGPRGGPPGGPRGGAAPPGPPPN